MLKYSDIKDYADEGLVQVEMKITADADDWYRFQRQPFYKDLKLYLESEGIAQKCSGFDAPQDKWETQPSSRQVSRGLIGLFLEEVHRLFSRCQ